MVVKLGNLGGGKKNIIIPRGLTQKHATTKKYVKNLECFFFVITAKKSTKMVWFHVLILVI